MAQVKENDRTWDVSVTVFHVKKLKEQLKPILLTDPDTLADILEDEVKQYDLVWMLVETQAKALSIDAEQFAKIFTDKYEEFVSALVGSLTDFFRKSKRVDLSALIKSILDASTKMHANAEKNLSSGMLSKVVDQVIENHKRTSERELEKILTNLSGESPES